MNLRRAVLLAGVAIVLAFKPVGSQELIWSANYGGQFNDNGYAGQRAGDGGYILLGSTYSFGSGGFDFYLLKVSPAGDTLWTKTFGGAATDIGYDVAVTADGGFIMVGSTRSLGAGGKDVYLIRADSSGAVLWEKNYGGSGQDEGRSVRQISDNGFIICGTTSSYGSGYDDVYFIRTDSIGDTVWTTTVGGGGGESGSAVRQTADGGFIAVGSTGSFGDGYSSLYAIRLNANGDSVWTAVYGGGGADFGYALEITPDQGFIFSGGTASFSAGYTDAYLVKTDAGGNVEWEKSYGGAFDDRAYAVMRAMDGGYLLVGTTESFGAAMIDLYLIKTNPVGDTVWTRRYGGSQSDYGQAVFPEGAKDYIIIGYSYSNSFGGADVFIGKVGGESTPVEEDIPGWLPSGYALEQNYPNPFNTSTIIEYVLPRRSAVRLAIYNILGQEIRGWEFVSLPAGTHRVVWDGRDNRSQEAASGIYFYRMTTADYSMARKMVLLK